MRIAEKSLLDQFYAVLDPLWQHFFSEYSVFLFSDKFPTISYLTKKETDDAFKRLSSYRIGALNFLITTAMFFQIPLYTVPKAPLPNLFRVLYTVRSSWPIPRTKCVLINETELIFLE